MTIISIEDHHQHRGPPRLPRGGRSREEGSHGLIVTAGAFASGPSNHRLVRAIGETKEEV
jgi:hypothetical protein